MKAIKCIVKCKVILIITLCSTERVKVTALNRGNKVEFFERAVLTVPKVREAVEK